MILKDNNIKRKSHKDKSYFEGWYFKIQVNNIVFAFIPGISIDAFGNKNAFIQVITNNTSYYFKFKYDEFYMNNGEHLHIRIGENVFSEIGIKINIKDEHMALTGNIRHTKFTKIKKSIYSPSIMGPFSYIPNMECNHEIISLRHNLKGHLNFNGEVIDFTRGIGYIEKDCGTSFPKSWIWIQCNNFINSKASFIFSIGKIPIKGYTFDGFFSILNLNGKEYRFATYNGAKILSIVNHKSLNILIKKRDKILEIKVSTCKGENLIAPVNGNMTRNIIECSSCKIKVKLFDKDNVIFENTGLNSGYENLWK